MPSRLLLLPEPVLADIGLRSGNLQNLRCACKQLRVAITPTTLVIAYKQLNWCDHDLQHSDRDLQHVEQDLQQSDRLAAAWRDATRLNVLGEDFNDAATRGASIMEHTKLLLLFFNEVAFALMPWRQLQSASVPFSTPLVIALVAKCQLTSLTLSDCTFQSEMNDRTDWNSYDQQDKQHFDERHVLRPQVASCLNLLRGYSNLKTLELKMTVVWVEPRHIDVLSELTQLEDLSLGMLNEGQTKFDFDAQDVIDNVNHLTQLTSLCLTFGHLFVHEIELGPLPFLQTLALLRLDEDACGDEPVEWGQSALEGCPYLKKVTLENIHLSSYEWCSPLCNLKCVHLISMNLDDELACALEYCTYLELLEVGTVRLSQACRSVLPSLTQLRLGYMSSCEVPLSALAPNLRRLQPRHMQGHRTIAMLAGHPKLASLEVCFSWLEEGTQFNGIHTVLVTLTAITSLNVIMDNVKIKPECHRIAAVLNRWLAGLHGLQVTRSSSFTYAPSQKLRVLLDAMPQVRLLRLGVPCVRSCYAEEACMECGHPREFAADAMVWVLTGCARGMKDLEVVEANVCWLMVEEKSSEHGVGWLPHLTAFLVGLAAAPRLALVRLVNFNSSWKILRQGSDAWKMFNRVHRYVELAKATLPFVVEVV